MEDGSNDCEKALIPCAVCRQTLDNPYGSANQPSGGTEFTSAGHYGSTVSDLMDGTYLALNICDPCLIKLKDDGAVGRYRSSGFNRWAA